jgi:organic radical activating enzyme
MHSGLELGNIKHRPIQQIINGSVHLELKQTMSRKEWHPSCSWCQQLENTTGSSGRTVRRITEDTAYKIDKDIEYFELQHLVVNWSNLCNLTCVYCNAETSTAWQSVEGIPISYVRNNHLDLIALAKQHSSTIQGIVLGGGEPLLQKGLPEFLQRLIPDQVQVVVTTNLSVDLDNSAVYQILRHWPRVDWQVSFDNVDADKFEYVRDGACWDKFASNIRTMKSHDQHVVAHPAYSIYCAFDLMEYYDFCVVENLGLFWCELTYPWDLDVRRCSWVIRKAAMSEIDRVLAEHGHRRGMAIDTLRRYRMSLEDNSYIFNVNDYQPDILGWHENMEHKLNKKNKFIDLWPQFRVAT